jgi:hypothetical protein
MPTKGGITQARRQLGSEQAAEMSSHAARRPGTRPDDVPDGSTCCRFMAASPLVWLFAEAVEDVRSQKPGAVLIN